MVNHQTFYYCRTCKDEVKLSDNSPYEEKLMDTASVISVDRQKGIITLRLHPPGSVNPSYSDWDSSDIGNFEVGQTFRIRI